MIGTMLVPFGLMAAALIVPQIFFAIFGNGEL